MKIIKRIKERRKEKELIKEIGNNNLRGITIVKLND